MMLVRVCIHNELTIGALFSNQETQASILFSVLEGNLLHSLHN
jgi:hypothetical protein